MREADTLRKRRHPHIVPLLASFTRNVLESSYEVKYFNMIFPHAEMDMEQWMSLEQPPLFLRNQSRECQRRYLYQAICDLISGLAFLHREIDGMVTSHHDLKPRNILAVRNVLMICDLGRSHLIPLEYGSETEGQSGLGTYTYHPPEYWNDDGTRATKAHGRAFDVWAMACIMIEVAILIVYDWESQKVKAFREDRLKLPDTVRRFPSQSKQGGPDDSFHNSISVVDAWLLRLEEDGSPMMKQTLAVAVGMLRQDPKERLYSWEALLDMYEILNSDEPNAELLKKSEEKVQKPYQSDLAGCATPLHRASSRGNLNRVIALVRADWKTNIKDSAGNLPYDLAHCNGYHAVCSFLGRADSCSSSGRIMPADACLTTRSVASDVHVREGNGFRVREHLAVASGQDNRLDVLSETGAKLTTATTGPLKLTPDIHLAARGSDLYRMRFFLDQKNANLAIQMTDEFGWTPLHHASESSSAEMVSLILQASSEPHRFVMSEDQHGRTPLHLAVTSNKQDVAEVLLRAGRNKRLMIRKEDGAGETPLQIALKNRNLDLVELLQQTS